MSDTQIVLTVLAVLWITISIQIATMTRSILSRMEANQEWLYEAFEGLREYLYEIDPQFDEERELTDGLNSQRSGTLFDGKFLMELEREKRKAGRRILRSRFTEGGFRSPRQSDFEQ